MTGNPGKRPLNAHEPRPEPAATRMPAGTKSGRQAGMDAPDGELSKLNLVTHLDRGALATYCGAYGIWAEAMSKSRSMGPW